MRIPDSVLEGDWESVPHMNALRCPCGHTIELDGECPNGHVSILKQKGLI